MRPGRPVVGVPAEFVGWILGAAVTLVGGVAFAGFVGTQSRSDLVTAAVFGALVVAVGSLARHRGWRFLLAFLLGLLLTVVIAAWITTST